MTAYLIRRAMQMLVVLILSSLAIYFLLNLVPGGPLSQLKLIADPKARLGPNEVANWQHMLELDKPVQVRYFAWLLGDDWMGSLNPAWQGHSRGIIRGDFGESWKTHRRVSAMMRERLPNTIVLMALASLLSLAVAVPLGIYSAVRQYSRADYLFTLFSFVGIAIPAFWFGLIMIILFSDKFRDWGLPYLPSGGTVELRAPRPGSLLYLIGAQPGSILDRAVHLIMPAVVLSLLYMAGWGRYVRSSMLEVLRQDYMRTARAKGLAERLVIARHGMRNALIPLVTIVTFEIAAIFGGAILIETVFSYPGMGRLYITALQGQDWPVVQAYLIILAVLVVLATLLSDILYTVVDPRIRFD
jgi:peptide/nickel transport system permease protein